ncbi:MAG: hypothetical protein LIO74_10805 [Ruminococcus sp.]|nr:hypothetical protein [Ruminococcus sp.]
MTIDEAAKKWGVGYQMVLEYIYKEYIPDIEGKGSQLILPDLPKPYTKSKSGKIKQETIYKTILRICNDGEYVNANLLKITEEQFEAYMNYLQKAKCLEKADLSADLHSNLGWIITFTGVDVLSKKKFSLPNITINNTMKNGLVNL